MAQDGEERKSSKERGALRAIPSEQNQEDAAESAHRDLEQSLDGGMTSPDQGQGSSGGIGNGRSPLPHSGRRKVKFTEEEKEAIASGVDDFGPGKWTAIREGYLDILERRTPAQIKDCYRTMLKRGDISPDVGAEAARAATFAKAVARRSKKASPRRKSHPSSAAAASLTAAAADNTGDAAADASDGEHSASDILARTASPAAAAANDADANSPSSSPVTTSARRRKRFTDEEKYCIKKGVEKFGKGNWGKIKDEFVDELRDRTGNQVKDCYRTMLKHGEVEEDSDEERERLERKKKRKHSARARGKKGAAARKASKMASGDDAASTNAAAAAAAAPAGQEDGANEDAEDGNDAPGSNSTIHVGINILKKFKGYGYFEGEVVASPTEGDPFFRVQYEDGDEEEMDRDEVERGHALFVKKHEGKRDTVSPKSSSKKATTPKAKDDAAVGAHDDDETLTTPKVLFAAGKGDAQGNEGTGVAPKDAVPTSEAKDATATADAEEDEERTDQGTSSEDEYSDEEEYYDWSNLWSRLRKRGWASKKAGRKHPLLSYLYIRPGCDPQSPESEIGIDFFGSAQDVIAYQRDQDILKRTEENGGEARAEGGDVERMEVDEGKEESKVHAADDIIEVAGKNSGTKKRRSKRDKISSNMIVAS